MARQRMPLAFYFNSLAMILYFLAIFIHEAPWHTVLRWVGTVALVIGIVLLVMRK